MNHLHRAGVFAGPSIPPSRRRARLMLRSAASLAIGALVIAACGSGDDSGSEVTTSAGEIPERIISLSPTHTEMLFAIGAGDQVIAVDGFSNYPAAAEAKMTDLSGFEPNVEAIASFDPDLVITEGTNPALLEQLDSLDIPSWSGPAVSDFDGIFEQIGQLGEATGQQEGAAALIDSMQAEIAEIDASVAGVDIGLRYYHELDPTYFSVTSDTFIGYVYGRLGLTSIADAAEGAGGGFPQLNAEFILDADPDLIFLACTKYCGETAESVAARPGWEGLAAVTTGRVLEMDDDIASRWGPRIVDYYRIVAASVTELSTELATAGATDSDGGRGY